MIFVEFLLLGARIVTESRAAEACALARYCLREISSCSFSGLC